MGTKKIGLSRRIFLIINTIILILLALTCFLPLLHVLAISFSSSAAATSGQVGLWPVDFTLGSYEYVARKPEFWRAASISVLRVVVGVPFQMLITILVAYPLSKEEGKLMGRKVYLWYFVVTMLFSGGLIPTYLTIDALGLIDSFWALILPGAVPIFNIILLLNFFRNLPNEIDEAAQIDGANYWICLWKIFVPLSKPALATLVLFSAVGHWNSWFDGLIYMNKTTNYPLQSYLQTVVVAKDMSMITSAEFASLKEVSDRTNKAAQVFLAMIPIICIYPFLQKYFTKGIVLGSVKG
ncbi:MAG: carbohydrate ABC transporter permease [Cellulosilyticaceae bacterium]